VPYPVIPEYITVHLGAPDAPAENVTVTFPRYIKGVAASEIYPTWNESAIRANVLAQISVALNRVYTEFYRSRGYDFDITNNTQYDQAFSPNKETFENINAIVDDMFNNYIVRRGNVEPLYAQFCDGIRTQCRGLSQWGSQELAQQGRTPYEILQYYYGQDIDLVYNAPVGDSTPSYPGRPLTVGSVGEDVRTIQRELNRIRKNYPALPAVGETDGVFGADHRRRRPHFPAHFQFDPGRHCGQGHLVSHQVHLQRRQEPLRGHQRGPDHLRGPAAVPQGPPPGRHRHRRPDHPVLSGVSGLLPAGAAAHPHH